MAAPQPTPAADPNTTEQTRTWGRLVAWQSEAADTPEAAARHLLRQRACAHITGYAFGGVGPYRAARADAARSLEALAARGATLAGADLRGRRHPGTLITPNFLLPVDVAIGPDRARLFIDYDAVRGPRAADTAVRLLVAGANGEPDTVHVIAAAERHLHGVPGLLDTLVWLAELGAGLITKGGS